MDMFNYDVEPECTTLKEISFKQDDKSIYACLMQRGDKFELITQTCSDKPTFKEFAHLHIAEDTFKWFVIEGIPFLEEHERNNNCQH